MRACAALRVYARHIRLTGCGRFRTGRTTRAHSLEQQQAGNPFAPGNSSNSGSSGGGGGGGSDGAVDSSSLQKLFSAPAELLSTAWTLDDARAEALDAHKYLLVNVRASIVVRIE